MSEDKEFLNPNSEHSRSSNPESTRHLRRVSELFEQGLDSNDIFALHGTSIEAILHLARVGRLPASGSFGSELYLIPEELKHLNEDDELPGAEEYAHWNARKYYVLSHLPFRPSNMVAFGELAVGIDDGLDNFLDEAASHGMTKKQFLLLREEAERVRKGVVVALSHRIKEDFEILEDYREQKKIVVPEGLPIDYITGIEPLGQYEWAELEKLQEEADNL